MWGTLVIVPFSYQDPGVKGLSLVSELVEPLNLLLISNFF